MAFVLDSSVAMAWCFEDEVTAYADHVLELLDAEHALVPSIWPLEVANALCVAERRGRLEPADTAHCATLLRSLPLAVQDVSANRALSSVLDLARAQQLSSYDASYLELAMREGLPLATQDARLRTAAARVGVPLVQPRATGS